MANWDFWAVAAFLAALVAGVLIAALRRAPVASGTGDADLAVYRDQLAEIERDLGRGTLSADEAVRLRAEVGKRVLDTDRARKVGSGSSGPARTGVVVGLVLGAVVPGALAAYWWLGAPGYADMALAPRLTALDDAIRSRPSQEAELVTQGHSRDAALDAQLASALAAESDVEALRAKFQSHLEAGEMQAAVRVQERILALQSQAASGYDHAMMALALVLEAQGYVSPEAEAQLRASLQLDASNEIARYLVGEMFRQGARFDRAFQFWRPIAENGTPGSPFVADVREKIEQVAELAGIPYVLPQEDASGPSNEDMAAAGEMTPEERQQMIEGMVAQLSDRLATDGGTVEEWNRLIRSLAVLERLDDAQKIYDEAKQKFEGRPAELSFLRLAAVETGLNP